MIDTNGHDDEPWWSTSQITYNLEIGNFWAQASIKLQRVATRASGLGATFEVGGALIGSQVGSTVGLFGGLADGPLPVIELGAGLGGFIEGAKIGHNIHKKTTDKAESFFSNLSAFASYTSDVFLGNTRLDFYSNHAEIVLGESSATALATSFIGGLNRAGVVDILVDRYASCYAESKCPGLYGLTGSTGRKFQIFEDDLIDPYLPIPHQKNNPYKIFIKLGDKHEAY
jgi:hypothetical protein